MGEWGDPLALAGDSCATDLWGEGVQSCLMSPLGRIEEAMAIKEPEMDTGVVGRLTFIMEAEGILMPRSNMLEAMLMLREAGLSNLWKEVEEPGPPSL